jgi:hypothetical protein
MCATIILLGIGCNKKEDNSINFRNAIDTYYSAHPACLWSEPFKFPVQADTSDNSKTAGYDALVDQGFLVRTTAGHLSLTRRHGLPPQRLRTLTLNYTPS